MQVIVITKERKDLAEVMYRRMNIGSKDMPSSEKKRSDDRKKEKRSRCNEPRTTSSMKETKVRSGF